MLYLNFFNNFIDNFNEFFITVLFNKVPFCVILIKIFNFSSQLNSVIIVVNEFHKNMFYIRFEKFQVLHDGHKSVHFLLEKLPNKLLFSWKFLKLFLTKNTDVWNCFNKFILGLVLFSNFRQRNPSSFSSLLLRSIMELISLFVQIKVGIIYDVIFVKFKIFVTVKVIMLKNWFGNGF